MIVTNKQSEQLAENAKILISQISCATMIEMQPFSRQGVYQIPQDLHKEMICQELFQITNKKWRIISRHI